MKRLTKTRVDEIARIAVRRHFGRRRPALEVRADTLKVMRKHGVQFWHDVFVAAGVIPRPPRARRRR